MNVNFLYSVFTWTGIIGAALTFISVVGIWQTGKVIEKSREVKISSLEDELVTVQPRILSEEQKMRLVNELKSAQRKSSIVFVSRLMDGESNNYATQLEGVFRQAGWSVGEQNRTLLDDFPGFLTAAISNDGDYQGQLASVQNAFLSSGIDFRSTEIRQGSISVQQQPNTIYIIVGRKN